MPIAVWAEPRLNGKWYIIELKITVGEEDLFEDFSSLAKESLSRLHQGKDAVQNRLEELAVLEEQARPHPNARPTKTPYLWIIDDAQDQ